MADHILVPTAPGELIDKLTILRLKEERITDAAKVANVRVEKAVLMKTADAQVPPSAEPVSYTHLTLPTILLV